MGLVRGVRQEEEEGVERRSRFRLSVFGLVSLGSFSFSPSFFRRSFVLGHSSLRFFPSYLLTRTL